eukprot:5503163-Pyramimonas_sp.AAC.1
MVYVANQLKTAAKHRNGKGLEESGADTTDLRRHLEWLMKRGSYREYGALLLASCAGTWPRARQQACFGEKCDDNCECGAEGTDDHLIWNHCDARDDHDTFNQD